MNRCPQLSECELSAREKLFKGKNIKNLKRVKLKVTFITEDSHHAVLSRLVIQTQSYNDIMSVTRYSEIFSGKPS